MGLTCRKAAQEKGILGPESCKIPVAGMRPSKNVWRSEGTYRLVAVKQQAASKQAEAAVLKQDRQTGQDSAAQMGIGDLVWGCFRRTHGQADAGQASIVKGTRRQLGQAGRGGIET